MRICFKNLQPCPFSINEAANTAFVYMPFQKELQEVYRSGIKATLEDLGWTCHRSDEKFDTPEIICTICKNTQEASLVIADLTGRNPNVFLELGLAFGLQKYVVLLSQTAKDIPFDTRTFRTILYSAHEIPQLKANINTLIKSIKIPLKIPEKTIFESRCTERKRVREPPQKPLMEIFIGPTSETEEWLPTTEGNLSLMNCIPYVFGARLGEVVPRRRYFEFKSKSPESFVRMDSDGFFHAVMPLSQNSEAGRYYLSWIIGDIAEALFFVVRIMKKKRVRTEQALRIDLHGIGGLEVLPFQRALLIRKWSFSTKQDAISYKKTLNPEEKWSFFFNLLCEIYRDICIDLGVIDMRDEYVKQNVNQIINSMETLRTSYSPSGLEALSLKEIFGDSVD